MNNLTKKIGITLFILLSIFIYFKFNGDQFLNLESLRLHHQSLLIEYQNNPLEFTLIYVLIYILLVALSFPGATVMSLAGGYFFGFTKGLIIINWSSTIGATFAFLIARLFLRDYLQNKFHNIFLKINRGIEREGNQYLFTLRLIPIFPFFLVNILMGLTNISLLRFFIISLIGMLPGTAVYVWAGTTFQNINSINDVFSLDLLVIFFAIGIIPLLQSKILTYLKQRKNYLRFNKPTKFDFNLIVIGGGAAGLVNAFIAANLKAKVLLIEEDKMGGECLNYGCVPSKTFIQLSKTGRFNSNNYQELKNEIKNTIDLIAPHDSIERYQSLGVDCVKGKAKILSPYEVEVEGKKFTAKKMVLATGAKPLIPSIEGLDLSKIYHYENIWNLNELPPRMIIVGGGVIAFELAQAFNKLGSKVIIIEQSEVLALEDRDAIELVKDAFKKQQIDIFEKTQILKIDHLNKTLEYKKDRIDILKFDEILFACGKVGNSDFVSDVLDLDKDSRQFIQTNEKLETLKYRNIYACGDINGIMPLTNAAAHQAWYTSVNALFGSLKSFNHDSRFIPHAVFIEPEIARVGMNEKEAIRNHVKYDVHKYDSSDLDRSLIEKQKLGFIKVLTVKDTDQIIGVTIVGKNASEIISEFVLAMKYNLGLNKILSTSHIYPSFSEQNKYVAGVWKSKSVNPIIYKLLEYYQRLMR